jgi:hypothetical protein
MREFDRYAAANRAGGDERLFVDRNSEKRNREPTRV